MWRLRIWFSTSESGSDSVSYAGMNELAIVLCLAVLTWLSQPAEDGSSTRRAVHRVLAIVTAVAASLALAEYTQRVAMIRF